MVFIYHSGDNDSWNFLASPGSSLSLSIEVDSSDRKAKFVLLSKLACIEMIPRGWHNYSLPTLLLEEHKNEPVDTNAGLWALIAYDFPSCNSNARKMHIKNKYMQAWNDLMQVRERTYQKRHPLFQADALYTVCVEAYQPPKCLSLAALFVWTSSAPLAWCADLSLVVRTGVQGQL